VAERAHLGDGRRAGGRRAGHVKRDRLERAGEDWSAGGGGGLQAADPRPVRAQGHPYYASARLWDDGIIDPAQTREVLGLAMSAALNAPIERRASACSGCRGRAMGMFAEDPDRQPRRDRLPRHPHRARMGVAHRRRLFRRRRDALHVAMADEAHHIGAARARESYLRGDRIIAAALATGAEAIHPGYGFLSENADFAEPARTPGWSSSARRPRRSGPWARRRGQGA
jgi:hypothetical protein